MKIKHLDPPNYVRSVERSTPGKLVYALHLAKKPALFAIKLKNHFQGAQVCMAKEVKYLLQEQHDKQSTQEYATPQNPTQWIGMLVVYVIDKLRVVGVMKNKHRGSFPCDTQKWESVVTIVSQQSKCLKFMTFRERRFVIRN